MAESTAAYVPIKNIGIRRRATASLAIIGNPNSGKSTLFNRLTGLNQTTGNYPGVTVEKHSGTIQLENSALELVDLPGIYCLSGFSADERIAVDVVMGRIDDLPRPDGLIVVLDTTHLYQGLYLLQQLMELQLPIVVALTMTDVATASGIDVSLEVLQRRLGGMTICPVVATTGRGIDQLKEVLGKIAKTGNSAIPESWPELSATADELAHLVTGKLDRVDVLQALLHPGSPEDQMLSELTDTATVSEVRTRLFGDEPPQAVEARHRYRWVRAVLAEAQLQAPIFNKFSAKFLRSLNRPGRQQFCFLP